jgi:hypothetical protein
MKRLERSGICGVMKIILQRFLLSLTHCVVKCQHYNKTANNG